MKRVVFSFGNFLHSNTYSLFPLIICLPFFVLTGCRSRTTGSDNNELIIFHAGSLAVPVKIICEAYQKEHPSVVFFNEAAGSVASARKITDLKKPCDIMLSADYNVIDKFLIPDYADWNIKFARNEMVIAFTKKSKGGDTLSPANWPAILLKEDIFYGRSDPDADPCGYRTVFTLKLAEKYLKANGLVNRFLEKDRQFVRPKEVDLIALLESHAIDFIFIYKSVARQHRLMYLELPDSLNLSNPHLADWYSTVSTNILGEVPGKTITQYGEAMVYGLTIPQHAPNYNLALDFVGFLLSSDKGMKILDSLGQQSVIPSFSDSYNQIPLNLKRFALPE